MAGEMSVSSTQPSRRSLLRLATVLVLMSVLIGSAALVTVGQSAEQTQPEEDPTFEVPMESLLLVAGVAAVGGFVGALLANLLWSRQMGNQSQQRPPRPQNAQQGQPAQQQPRSGGQPSQQQQSSGGQRAQGQPPQGEQNRR